jgi:WD40 repeat protein
MPAPPRPANQPLVLRVLDALLRTLIVGTWIVVAVGMPILMFVNWFPPSFQQVVKQVMAVVMTPKVMIGVVIPIAILFYVLLGLRAAGRRWLLSPEKREAPPPASEAGRVPAKPAAVGAAPPPPALPRANRSAHSPLMPARLWQWCERNPFLAKFVVGGPVVAACVAISYLFVHIMTGYDPDPVSCVAFSPDGKRLVTASQRGSVRLWDVATGQEILTLKGRALHVRSVAFSADGERLVSASLGRTVQVWDAATGRELLKLTGNGGASLGVAFSPDAKRVALASQERKEDGRSEGTVRVWDAATGREVLTLMVNAYVSRGEAFGGVAFSPDGKRLAASGFQGPVKVWDVANGQEIRKLGGGDAGLAFSPDGKRLAACDDRMVTVWDTASGQRTLTLKGHTVQVLSVAFSPDGSQLATASWDRTVKVWDAATGREVRTLTGHTDRVTSVAFSPDGKQLASASRDGTVRVWDTATGQEVQTLKLYASRV